MHWLLVGVLALAPLPAGANRPVAWSVMTLALAVILAINAIQMAQGHGRTIVVPRAMRVATALFCLFAATIVFQFYSNALLGFSTSFWKNVRQYPDLPTLGGSATINPFATQTALLRFLAYAAAFWLAYQIGHSRRQSRIVLFALTITITTSSLYALAENFDILPPLFGEHYKHVPTGSFINRNNFATYAGFGVIISLTMFQHSLSTERTKARRLVEPADLLDKTVIRACLLTGLFVCATALLLSQSRGALIGVGGAVTFLLLGRWQPLGRRGLATLASCVLAGLLALLVITSGAATLNRFENIEVARLEIWRVALAAIQQGTLIGSGYGTFRERFRLAKDDAALWDLHYAHNTYIDLAMTAGVMGMVLLLTGIAVVVVHCWLNGRARCRSAVEPTAAIAAAILAALHSIVDFSLQIPAIALTFAVILGLGGGVAAAAQGSTRAADHR